MGIIVNPRGTSGAGKTHLVRRLLADWQAGNRGQIEPMFRTGRAQPMGYCLLSSDDRPRIVVLGHYERTSGGCDTITVDDGGVTEIIRLADEHAASGARVLLEGAMLSEEHRRSAELAKRHRLCILSLDTPPETCVSQLIARRHARRGTRDAITATVTGRQAAVANACTHLEAAGAIVMRVSSEAALTRARALLGIASASPEAEGRPLLTHRLPTRAITHFKPAAPPAYPPVTRSQT